MLPIVRAAAPNPAAMVALRQQLQAASAVGQRRMVDVALAESVVVSMAATKVQPRRPTAAKPTAKPAAARKPASRRRLSSGYTSPDLRHELANWS